MELKIKSLLVVADGVMVRALTVRQPVWVQAWTAETLAVERKKKVGGGWGGSLAPLAQLTLL